jgi:hypothetical protein
MVMPQSQLLNLNITFKKEGGMMAYKYFNQYNYANIPYPSPTLPNATVSSGGCGVVCASMIVSNLTDKIVDPVAMAAYAQKKRARVVGGTDMNLLAKALCIDYPLTYRTTNDENQLLDHLRKGGMAVANVGGNRPGYTGVFSDGGHYVIVAGLNNDGRVIVLDPGLYNGKFNKKGRKGKVTVKGNECLCDMSVLAQDTANRSPAYWLFERKVEEVPEWMRKIIDDALVVGLITERHNPTEPATKWFVLAIALNLLKIVKGGR